MNDPLTEANVAKIRERDEEYGDVNAGDVITLCASHELLRKELERIYQHCHIQLPNGEKFIEHWGERFIGEKPTINKNALNKRLEIRKALMAILLCSQCGRAQRRGLNKMEAELIGWKTSPQGTLYCPLCRW